MASAKRSLSQNFLVDPNLQRKIVDALEAEDGDLVVEIGPGHGELTRHLLGRVARLLLVEKDDELAAGLEEEWGGRGDVRVLHGDALEVDLEAAVRRCRRAAAVRGDSGREDAGREGGGGGGEGGDADGREERAPYRVISNVPYAITSPLTFRVLDLRPPPRRAVLTVQEEVGERMAADPGSKAYGALSVGVQIRARPRVAFGVSRHAFRPTPDVESVTVVLEPRADRPGPEEERAARRLTRACFSRRRKQMQKILRSAPEYGLEKAEARELCRDLGLDPRVRPEKVAPGDFLRLARRLEG